MNRAKTRSAQEDYGRCDKNGAEQADVLSLLSAVRFGLKPWSLLADHLGSTGVHPALIHACMETGLLICDRTLAQATTEDLVRRNVAIDRWERMNPDRAPAARLLTIADLANLERHDDGRSQREVGKHFRFEVPEES